MAANAGAGAGQPPVAQQAPNPAAAAAAAPLPVAFALSPAQAGAQALIDYSTSEGAKIYKANTEALDTKFDGNVKNLRVFLADAARHATAAGWDEITNVDTDGNGTMRSLFTQYGLIKEERVRAAAVVYIGNNDRAAQNAYQMYLFLYKSLDEAFKAKVLTKEDMFIVNRRHDGPSLLKLIVTEVKVQTRSTSSHIRQSLMSLDKYMKETAKSDISAFNRYVQECRDDLASYGEESTDLLLYLFRAYQASSDAEFNRYVKDKQNEYNEGKDMTVDELMLNADTKYKTLLQAEAWCEPSPEQAQIIALQSTIDKLKTAAKTLKKTKETKPKKEKKDKKDHEWKYANPDNATTKQKNGRTYHWCKNHKDGMWVLHHPSQCNAARRNDTNTGGTTTTAMMTQVDHESETASESEEEDSSAAARVLSAILEDIRDDGHDE